MKPIVLILPYPVSANRYWRPVAFGSRLAMVPTKEAKAYKTTVGNIARAAGLQLPFEGRVLLKIDLYPQRPQDFVKRARTDPDFWDDDVRCMDLGNCEKVLEDALNGIAYLDDKQIYRCEKERHEPTGEAHLVVTLSKYERPRKAPDLFAVGDGRA